MARGASRRSVIALITLVLVVLLFAMGSQAQNGDPVVPQFPDIHLPSPARGGAALTALAPYLQEIAASHGKSVDELRSLLLSDNTLWTDTRGRLYYGCELGTPPVNAPGAESASAVLEAPFADSQTFSLHSRPGSTKVIYLDFNGHVTNDTLWNVSYGNLGSPIFSDPFDLDGVPSSFSSSELERIQYIWQRVAEDFAPFEVDVTTQDPGVEALRKTSSTDGSYGIRVVISPTNWYSSSAGGVSYVGSFSWDTDTPCFVFTGQLGPNDEKDIAEAVSHETGHTLGLNHDGVTGGTAYYQGHGNWAPIMGVGYYKEVVQWSKGEYAGANNTEDDLAIMQGFGIPYRADDHGDFIGNATPLAGPSLSASGVIEQRADVDMFSFQTGAGTISLTVNPSPRSPNLDIYATLYDGIGNMVASNNGVGMAASITATVSTGTYYLAVDGVGTGDPSTGYSDYDSLGQYQITGTVVTPDTHTPVAVASASPTSGTAPLQVNFSSVGSSDPDGTIQSYHWDFADGSTSTSDSPAHLYTAAGTYTATLVVTDNAGLSATATVKITVSAPNQPPVAKAAATPASGYAPLAVSFSSAGSSDSDGSIQSYSWAFGDGGTSTSSSPAHPYNTPGTYTATLMVTDNGGLSATATVIVTVSAPNQPPVANATAAPASGYAPLAVSFSGAGSSDSDGSIQSYSWAFGDGSTSTSVSPSHTYNVPGAYNAVLTVTDNKGAQSTSSVTISSQQDLTKLPDLIVSRLTTSTSSAAPGASITVTDTTKNQGVAQATASATFIYFSLDAALDAGDTLIGSRSLGVLGSGSSSAGSTVVTIPANALPGTRYLIVVADGGQSWLESNETNNSITKSISITGPDLIVSSLSSPSSAVKGSTITVKDTTKNQGAMPAGSSTTSYYLSVDSVYQGTDVYLGSRNIGSLLNGILNTGSADVTIPAGTAAGTYYLIARADGGQAVAETNETNNTKAAKIVVK